jgi:hypothetical protein
MEQVLDAASSPPSAAASVALGFVWLGGLVAVLVGALLVFAGAPPKYWHDTNVPGTRFVVSLPYKPASFTPSSVEGLRAAGGIGSKTPRRNYEVLVWTRDGWPGSSPNALEAVWVASRTAIAPRSSDAGEPVERAGLRGRQAEFVQGNSVCKLRVLADATNVLALSACASTREPEMDRFLDSLRPGTK